MGIKELAIREREKERGRDDDKKIWRKIRKCEIEVRRERERDAPEEGGERTKERDFRIENW